ncbi:hypothetical protein W02_35840 [Nitrospira sp. KM1]|uniref:VPLPA-CTERM sorting domain-containing protein n=1 Tax=Nitrospira sp. KM1 TaxID=1936990 RepID=UPI0013A78068|nr:VPLPA-CTERM sorting domain-containing protein [Nitrospira sp. KM1]BCA56444.1 hypothetical protein W02_35840 [Nitrospira sp. KM1]
MSARVNTVFRTVFGVVFSGLIAFNAQAATVYDEVLHGDLSDNHLSPTAVGLSVGGNVIVGSTIHQPLDRDFFSVTIGAGQVLNAIVLSSYTTTDDQSFFGLAIGNGFENLGFTGVDSWALIGSTPGVSVGNNLLDFITSGLVGPGVLGPSLLGPGVYSFWLQETEGSTTYSLDYQVAAVPLPAGLPLFLSGLLGIGAMARKTMLGSSIGRHSRLLKRAARHASV